MPEQSEDNFRVQAPVVSLPKGGGAIKGIGEKFTANPVTGTGSMSIPIATSPSRGGFGPQFSLSYDSGAGNGPFGFGWSLALPSISRKTDKGLPQYDDHGESDVFILSGAEDLVPVLQDDGSRRVEQRSLDGVAHTVHHYRPRIEGLFARIERWANRTDGTAFWRSISRDNITTWYGRNAESRIANPANPAQTFSWLICESRDDKGNAMQYRYAAENSAGVNLAQAHERNRTDAGRSAQRYLKRVLYGNRVSHLTDPALTDPQWMFEVVLDYGEPHYVQDAADADQRVFASATSWAPADSWSVRTDPFSEHRAGFEVRTYRLCRRVLMFHHFPDELGEPDYLVRSTEFQFTEQTVASFLDAVTHSGFVLSGTKYLKRSMPPVEFTYSQVEIDHTVQTLDADSMENLPIGVGGAYQFVDLDAEGISGVLVEHGDAWYYKPPLGGGRLGPATVLAQKPSLALANGASLVDLAGDGQLDLASFRGPVTGFFERTTDGGWEALRPFRQLPNIEWDQPNLRFVDLDGDGHADVMITEERAITWYPSAAEDGFGAQRRVATPLDEATGPALVFADGSDSIFLADMCGDGLTDLLRIRNGEVSYWPNLGYGRFGARVTMDGSPWFDRQDQFDPKRIRIADIDGSGNIDILYLASDRVRIFLNQCGNALIEARGIPHAIAFDDLTSVTTADVLGKGTACLVWTSSLPADSQAPMKFIDLMRHGKPHLLIRSENNLGAETVVHYTPSTDFYLRDKKAGRPWITRLAFPVHVVERTETYDRISRNRFVSRYAYHHGCFDGSEREFRGFGMVEQWDTEEFASLTGESTFPVGENVAAASHVPPVRTRTWYHTGVLSDSERVRLQFASEYYREPGLSDAQFAAQLLPDTTLPPGLTADEIREACRSLKGAVLRQEVYADDGSPKAPHPYSVTESSYTIRVVQRQGPNRHAVFFTHADQALSYQYERNPQDPRIGHALTLDVDDYGKVLTSASLGYGRRRPDPALAPADQAAQLRLLATFVENGFSNAIDLEDAHRTPLPCDSSTYEIAGLQLESGGVRFTPDEVRAAFAAAPVIPYEQDASYTTLQKRLIEQLHTRYRGDDLAPLAAGRIDTLGLPHESYKLALTPGLVAHVYGERLDPGILTSEGRYALRDGSWWLSSGTIRFTPQVQDAEAAELAIARQHFFLPRLFEDPFGSRSTVWYDPHDLFAVETRDAMDNRVTVGERDANGMLTVNGNDYRVLQPRAMMDANRNRSQLAFDALGLVVGTAVMGKPAPAVVEGDVLDSFVADCSEAEARAHLDGPLDDPWHLLQGASTRLVYDLFAYMRTKASPDPQPVAVSTIARETHVADERGTRTKVQVGFSYSDGFGREIQQKVRAEAGPVEDGGASVDPRWVGTGWTIFNNKGKPVRQYEPFFTASHAFEFGVQVGVSPLIFYDSASRVVGTLRPDHTWEKVAFDAWQQRSWDVIDTLLLSAKDDTDVGAYFRRLQDEEYLPSWHGLRTDAGNAPLFSAYFPDAKDRANETRAATQTETLADTPSVAYLDTLGRTFLTAAQNRFLRDGVRVDEVAETRVVSDLEGNQRAVVDALGRLVMRYQYDMLGTRIHQASMEAGQRWMLNNCMGLPIRLWDERGHVFRTTYDALYRSLCTFVRGADTSVQDRHLLVERAVYGDTDECGVPSSERELLNLRGQLYLGLDQTGITASVLYDFKGQSQSSTRQFAREYKKAPDWSAADNVLRTNPASVRMFLAPLLETETFQTASEADALGRPTSATTPDGTTVHLRYGVDGLLQTVVGTVQGAEQNDVIFVRGISYDALGRRDAIIYGNMVRTTYRYDPLTLRLRQLRSARIAQPPIDEAESASWPEAGLQDMRYTYDPAGNITFIRDLAQQSVFFRNQRIEPSTAYRYDALYRLIEAQGREQLGVANTTVPLTHDDRARAVTGVPTDVGAVGRYRQRFRYDLAGNILELAHSRTGVTAPGWSRQYFYEQSSLIDPGLVNNRLSRTQLNGVNEPYAHDAHGNMTSMPHMSQMVWDYRDQLQCSSQQVRAVGVPESTYYVYDSGGQRARKVTEHAVVAGVEPIRKSERLYWGAFERYREYASDGEIATVERDTLHVIDAAQRICIIETSKRIDAPSTAAPIATLRYQLLNHLGSSTMELDGEAMVISYEEFYPFGSTSFQSSRYQTAASTKRYRYSGMERDEESGLGYHTARYYAAWLGRWTAHDPAGLLDGLNGYECTRGNPISFTDTTGFSSQWHYEQTDAESYYHTWSNDNGGVAWKNLETGVVTYEGPGGEKYFLSDGEWVREQVEVTGGALVAAEEPRGPLWMRYAAGVWAGATAVPRAIGNAAAQVLDLATQGNAVMAKAQYGIELPYTEWSTTSDMVGQALDIENAGGGKTLKHSDLILHSIFDPIVAPVETAVGVATGKLDPVEAVGNLVGSSLVAGAARVHRNSLSSPAVNHVYEIYDSEYSQTLAYKTGISGFPLINGFSLRQQIQIRALNLMHPTSVGMAPRFTTGPWGNNGIIANYCVRRAALSVEQASVNYHANLKEAGGKSPPGNKRPAPNAMYGPGAYVRRR